MADPSAPASPQAPPSSSAETKAPPEGEKPAPEKSPEERAQEIEADLARKAYGLRKAEAKLRAEREEIAREKAEAQRLAEEAKKGAALKELDEFGLMEHVAKERGMTLEQLLKQVVSRYANGGKVTPEVEKEQMAAKVDALQAKLDAMEADAKARQEAELERQQLTEAETILNEVRGGFVEALSPEKHVFLSTFDQADVVEAAMRTANEYAEERGEMPELSDVLDYLEEVEAKKFEARALKAGYTKAQAAAMAAGTPAPAPERGPNGQFRPKVASNQQVAARGEAPAEWDRMTERERITRAGREVFGF